MKYTKKYLYELSNKNTPKKEKEQQKYERAEKRAEMKQAKRFLKQAFREMKTLAKNGWFYAGLITSGLSQGVFCSVRNTLENMGFNPNGEYGELLYVSWEEE